MKTSKKLITLIPKETLQAFIMLRDLQVSQEDFDERIKNELELTIETLNLKIEPIFDELQDLTPFIKGMKLIGSKLSRI